MEAKQDASFEYQAEQPLVTEFNVGRWCLSEDECIAQRINFAAYERGVSDAAAAFGRNRDSRDKRAEQVWHFCAPYGLMDKSMFLQSVRHLFGSAPIPGAAYDGSGTHNNSRAAIERATS